MTVDPRSPPVRAVETHISVLVFVRDRVYKLRKAVHFEFLDFTDRAVREADCYREVELNRRLAPDVYLGVADIVMDGQPVDHMVVMRWLPDERRLAALVRSGADVDRWLREVAADPGGVPCRRRTIRRDLRGGTAARSRPPGTTTSRRQVDSSGPSWSRSVDAEVRHCVSRVGGGPPGAARGSGRRRTGLRRARRPPGRGRLLPRRRGTHPRLHRVLRRPPLRRRLRGRRLPRHGSRTAGSARCGRAVRAPVRAAGGGAPAPAAPAPLHRPAGLRAGQGVLPAGRAGRPRSRSRRQGTARPRPSARSPQPAGVGAGGRPPRHRQEHARRRAGRPRRGGQCFARTR